VNRRRIVIGVSAVSGVAVLGMAAAQMSGGSSTPKGVDLKVAPVAAMHAAGPATTKAKTAQVDTVVTMATPAVAAKGATPAVAAKTTTMHGTGLFDFSRQVGRIDLTMANGSLQEVLTPAALYLHSGPPATGTATPTEAAAAAAAAKGWSKVDIGRLSDGNLVSGGSTDPSMAFAMLGGVQPDVKFVGQDKVREVPVAHYQGTLDLAEAAAAAVAPAGVPGAPADAAAVANAAADKKALTNAAHTFLTPKIPFDVYLDADGRVRRFVAKFSFIVPGPGHVAAEVTSTTDLFAFGTPIDVATPAAATPSHPAGGATPSPSRSAHK
jgi:hypothetical protein